MEYAAKIPFPGTPRALLLIASALALGVRAETVSYSGKVVDGAGNAVPWALLSLVGTDLVAESGADGAFTLSGNAVAGIYPDLKPPASVPPSPAVPDRYRADGRRSASPVTAALLWSRAPAGSGPAALPYSAYASAGDDRPPAPPASGPQASSAAAWTVAVAMARFQAGSFPQAAASGKGLVLALAPSATDTAAYAAEKRACLDTINALRASIGKPKVAWSRSLEAFADQGARYDAALNKAHAHFSAWSKYAVPSDAENAIPGWPLKGYKSVDAIVKAGAKMMWDEGPGGGHYDNIAGDQKEVGCGIYVTPAGAVWILHDFK